jgi:phosphoadenosine phosphosulfate reductase
MRISKQQYLFENPLQDSIDLLRKHEPKDGYFLAFSGGKDSCVLLAVAKMAGVKYEAVYSVVGLDPPELLQWMKKTYPIRWNIKTNIWKRISTKTMPPTRICRYCCDPKHSERGANGQIVLTGVRSEESARRKKQGQFRAIKNKIKVIRPLFYWSEADIWEFIDTHKIPYYPGYDNGKKRMGCIACPFISTKLRIADLEKYPKYREAFLRAFDRMIKYANLRGKKQQWKTPEEVMEWWLK